jgi:hypothetical protein
MIFATRETVALDLRTYGEDELAERVITVTDADLRRICERAGHYIYSDEYATPSGASMIMAKAFALAAVDILEGRSRDLRWKRRKLKGIHPAAS